MVDTIICGDSIEVMQGMAEKSVNLIVADPPYNIGKAEWDKIDNYIAWCESWVLECQRVLADNGSMYIFHNDFMQIIDLAKMIQDKTGFVFKQLISWDKWHNEIKSGNDLQGSFYKIVNNPALRNYPKMTEYILYYTFQDETGLEKVLIKSNFLPVSEKIRQYVESNYTRDFIVSLFLNEGRYSTELSASVHASYKMGWNNGARFDLMDKKLFDYLNKYLKFPFNYNDLVKEYESLRQEYESLRYTFNQFNNDTSIWFYPVCNTVERVKHPTQKPVALIENIIKHSSNECDIILDPFAGSCTTAVACKQLNRRYICIDNKQEYCDIGQARVDDVDAELNSQPLLFEKVAD